MLFGLLPSIQEYFLCWQRPRQHQWLPVSWISVCKNPQFLRVSSFHWLSLVLDDHFTARNQNEPVICVRNGVNPQSHPWHPTTLYYTQKLTMYQCQRASGDHSVEWMAHKVHCCKYLKNKRTCLKVTYNIFTYICMNCPIWVQYI